MLQSRQFQRFFIGFVLAIGIGGQLRAAEDPAGAWELVSYDGNTARDSVSGVLLLADGYFSLTYTMSDAPGELVGRARAGTYDVSADNLTYHVRWSMQSFGNNPGVSAEPFDRETTFSIDEDVLTITFTNGSVQKFRRAR